MDEFADASGRSEASTPLFTPQRTVPFGLPLGTDRSQIEALRLSTDLVPIAAGANDVAYLGLTELNRMVRDVTVETSALFLDMGANRKLLWVAYSFVRSDLSKTKSPLSVPKATDRSSPTDTVLAIGGEGTIGST
ncbi:hypothetical protein KJ059_02410 [Myxococcota bacterium]|nr:hypothetical protein [Myxococcota bacterium]MCZ7619813.1 hypothetical protein [Myxococcota bacterium]